MSYKKRNHTWLLVYTRPHFSAKRICIGLCILIWKTGIASPRNSFCLDSVWYHVKLLRKAL